MVFRGLHAASALPFRLLVCYARAERLAPGSHGTERPWWWRSVGYGAVGARKVWFWGSVHAEPVFWVFGLSVCAMCGPAKTNERRVSSQNIRFRKALVKQRGSFRSLPALSMPAAAVVLCDVPRCPGYPASILRPTCSCGEKVHGNCWRGHVCCATIVTRWQGVRHGCHVSVRGHHRQDGGVHPHDVHQGGGEQGGHRGAVRPHHALAGRDGARGQGVQEEGAQARCPC